MGDVLKVLKTARAVSKCNLTTFKRSPIQQLTIRSDKANHLSATLFSNLALSSCFHGKVRIALYNLDLHSIIYLCFRH